MAYFPPAVLVSHLAESTSFYLAALQPLGYRYISHERDGVAFGTDEVRFHLCEKRTNRRRSPRTDHITFQAPSLAALHAFERAAIDAGGSSSVDCGAGYRVTILDPDHNILEASFYPSSTPTVVSKAGRSVTAWQDDVARSAAPAPSVVAPTNAPFAPGAPQAMYVPSPGSDLPSAKAVVGTLLGAAGGAAVAYAMMRAESEGAGRDGNRQGYNHNTTPITMVDREVPSSARTEIGSRVSSNANRTAYASSAAPSSVRSHEAGSPRSDPGSGLQTLLTNLVPVANTAMKLLEASPQSTAVSFQTPPTYTLRSSTQLGPPSTSMSTTTATATIRPDRIPLPASTIHPLSDTSTPTTRSSHPSSRRGETVHSRTSSRRSHTEMPRVVVDDEEQDKSVHVSSKSTVVPDDSVSCVGGGSGGSTRSHHHSRASRHSKARSTRSAHSTQSAITVIPIRTGPTGSELGSRAKTDVETVTGKEKKGKGKRNTVGALAALFGSGTGARSVA